MYMLCVCYSHSPCVGNPLSFHPKHRLKSVEVLSNLINPTTFRLDSKKLTSKERKAIPHSLTHYPRSSPSLSSNTSSVSPLHIHTLTPQPNSHLTNGTSPVHHSDAIVIAKVSHSLEYAYIYMYMYMYMSPERGWLLVRVPPKAANFSFKNNCFGQVMLCCFVFVMHCVALPCLSKHLMPNENNPQYFSKHVHVNILSPGMKHSRYLSCSCSKVPSLNLLHYTIPSVSFSPSFSFLILASS